MAANLKSRCSKCAEMQKTYLKTLEEKRALLVKLQNEQERCRRFTRENEMLETRLQDMTNRLPTEQINSSNSVTSANSDDSRLERQLDEALTVNRKWRDEYEQMSSKHNQEKDEIREELNETRRKLEESKSHVLALETEVMRLAEALRNKGNQTAQTHVNNEDLDHVKIQMQQFKEDFSCERRDRERVQKEKECIQAELANAQEIIATLTQEVEMYREHCLRIQEENAVLRRRHSAPVQSQPQLQIVYPLNDPIRHPELRLQQQRRGVFTRGPIIPPPSAFYGGEVETDVTDGVSVMSSSDSDKHHSI
ncbi:predicted protein [Nematostella vectensis]|uniref:Uncharacterized protein n=1 Tax=Nematostella vectensis TaxID=45351 RepID=A7SDV7_NEMVE|nr:predicted protein [Nematostella vectensis]|eukprot:XP_001630142.1 predicted protein [Nematostella vectensis]